MKRHDSLVPLSREHHEVLILAQVLKKDIPDYKDMPTEPLDKLNLLKVTFTNNMKPHFIAEEKIAEYIRGRFEEIDKLSDEIISEHIQIENAISKLETSSNLVDDLDELGKLMDIHVRKEERLWFQLIQEKLGDEYLENLNSQ